ncbi:hypothetical protein N431DRAFT_460819 [Stipitochalara longipes BDJ]|nr:hypothetical protein N431DRAFT_460819 [Stipitochalara longipes BDJ]
MSEDQLTNRPPTSSSDIASMITAMLTDAEEDTSLPLARYLAEELPSSIEAPSSPLPSSTPAEPKAMTLAKAKQQSPVKGTKKEPRHITNGFPSSVVARLTYKNSDNISSPARTVRHSSSNFSSPNLITLPSRKRAGNQRSNSPAAKRRGRKEHTPTPAARARNDHWSPASSRASSPIRSAVHIVPISEAKWYDHVTAARSTFSPETPRQRVAKTNRDTSKSEEKRYPNSTSVTIGSLDDEEEKSKICYNCGKKGHWFMDCKIGCGKCGGDGHRTIDCVVVRPHSALGKR